MWWLLKVILTHEKLSTFRLHIWSVTVRFHGHILIRANCCCSSLVFFSFVSFRSSSANRRFVSIISFSVHPLQFLLYNRLREVTFISCKFERTYYYSLTTTIKIPNIKSRQRRGSFLSSFERRWSLLMCVLFVMFVFLLIL